MSAPKNVLTINFGGIGDEILFLPALKELRAILPGAKITLLLEPRSRSVEQVTDLIDATIAFDIKKRPLLPQDLLQLLKLIRQGGYDLVLSSGSSPQVSALLFLSGIPVRVGYGSNALAKLLLTDAVALDREQYAGNMYHDLTLGLKKYRPEQNAQKSSQVLIPEITVKEDSRLAVQKLLQDSGIRFSALDSMTGGAAVKNLEKIILIHPGTSAMAVQKGIIKTWPAENWLTLIGQLCQSEELGPKPIVLMAGGPDDSQVIAQIEEQLQKSGLPTANFYNLAGKTRGLSDLAALMELCDLIVCVDSAPMHLAVGLDKKIVALFGPTDPAKLIPQSNRFKVLADRPADQPRSLIDGLGVRLQPYIVYRSSMDLLKAESNR